MFFVFLFFFARMYNTERVLLLNESQLGLPWISQVFSVKPNKLLLKHYANEKEYKKVLQCHSKITSKVFMTVVWSPIQANYFMNRGPTWAPLDPGPGVNSPGVHQGPVSGPANIYIQIGCFLLVMVLFLSKNKLGSVFQNMLIFILNCLMRKVR